MTATELLDALRTRFPAEAGFILLPQVRDATGWRGNRTADAIAMNAWPSRGLEVHGFELKISRSDWQRELKQPAKAETIFGFCDRWWIVTSSPKTPIIRAGELPPVWGHLEIAADGRIAEATPAPKLQPAALDRSFVASVLRALQKCETPEARIASAFERGKDEGIKIGREAFRVSRSDHDVIRWKLDSLEQLERFATRTAGEMRRALTELKRDLPAFPEDNSDGRATDVHENAGR